MLKNIKDNKEYHTENSEIGTILVSKDGKTVFLGSALTSNPKDWELDGENVSEIKKCTKCTYKTHSERGYDFCNRYIKMCNKARKLCQKV